MKKVNFISSLPPQKQYEIRRWFWCTCIVWAISFVIGMYYTIPQLLTYRALRKEIVSLRNKTNDYADNLKKRDVLKNEHELLSQHNTKINRYRDQPKSSHQHVAVIVQASGDGVKLELLKFNKKNIECTIVCPTPEHATVFIKRLSSSDLFSGIKLVSLQSDAHVNQLRAVVKGTIVF